MVRRLVKAAAWLLGSCVLVLAAWFAINATDEALSEEARAAMAVTPAPAPDRDNAYLDFLVLGAPAGVPTFEAALERLDVVRARNGGVLPSPPWGDYRADPSIPDCAYGAIPGETWNKLLPCVETATATPRLRETIDRHGTLLGRYRAMRQKPRFVNLTDPEEEDAAPGYVELLQAQRLAILHAALRFKSGDRRGALGELEQDIAFYRRMLRDSSTLIEKMIAIVALDRATLFAVELARHTSRADAATWRGLERMLAPHTHVELELASLMRREYARRLRWMLDPQHVRLSDAAYASGDYGKRPWWDSVKPYLYRPNQTLNWAAASMNAFMRAGDRPPPEWAGAFKEARVHARSLEPGALYSLVFNPVGWYHSYAGFDYGTYAARVHARANIQSLALLTVKLRAAGISRPEEVETALAGPLGAAHADAFTGERYRFDPGTRTIGFEAEPTLISGGIRGLRNRYGRMALPL